MRLSLIVIAAVMLAATSAAAKTEPEKGCPSSHPVPVPYPPVKARVVDGKGHDCTGHTHGAASSGARDTPIKAHQGSPAGEIRGPVSGTVK